MLERLETPEMLLALLRSLKRRRPTRHTVPPVRHRSRAARPTLLAACAPEGSVDGGGVVVRRWWGGGGG